MTASSSAAPPGYTLLYPNLVTDFMGASACGPWVLTYTSISDTQQWKDASLMRAVVTPTW
jgi:hypothetical protein